MNLNLLINIGSFAILTFLWLGFAAALVFNPALLDNVWYSFRTWPLVVQVSVGLLVLPVALGSGSGNHLGPFGCAYPRSRSGRSDRLYFFPAPDLAFLQGLLTAWAPNWSVSLGLVDFQHKHQSSLCLKSPLEPLNNLFLCLVVVLHDK